MRTPILFDSTATAFNNFGKGTLKDAISCTVTEELNGAFELEMQYPVSGAHFNEIGIRSIIYACAGNRVHSGQEYQPFRVYSITKDASGHVATILARHVFYDLNGVPVTPFSGTNFSTFMSNFGGAKVLATPFTIIAGGTDYPNAEGSIDEPTTIGGVFEYLINAPYYCDLLFDGFDVNVLQRRRFDTGFSIKYGKNLTALTQENNCADLYTGVYVYYMSATGKVSGRIVRVSGYSYDNLLPVDVSDQFEDTPNATQLTNAANAFIQENGIGVPDVTLTVSFEQMHDIQTYQADMDTVEVGDVVSVIFEQLGVVSKVPVIRTVYEGISDRLVEISVGEPAQTLSGTIATSASKTQKTQDSYRITQKTVDKYCLQYREQLTSGSLDDITLQGHYYVVTANVPNVSGKPSDVSSAYNVIHFNSAGDRAFQILFTNGTGATGFWWRNRTSGGSWSPWTKVVNDEPKDIKSALGTVTPGTGMASCGITDAYYCHGYVTLRISPKTSGSLASGSSMSGQITFPPEYAPKMTTNGIGFYTSHACVCIMNSSGSFSIRNAGSTAIADGNTVYTTVTFPCG